MIEHTNIAFGRSPLHGPPRPQRTPLCARLVPGHVALDDTCHTPPSCLPALPGLPPVSFIRSPWNCGTPGRLARGNRCGRCGRCLQNQLKELEALAAEKSQHLERLVQENNELKFRSHILEKVVQVRTDGQTG